MKVISPALEDEEEHKERYVQDHQTCCTDDEKVVRAVELASTYHPSYEP
jgi:hypothetical protein